MKLISIISVAKQIKPSIEFTVCSEICVNKINPPIIKSAKQNIAINQWEKLVFVFNNDEIIPAISDIVNANRKNKIQD